MPPDSSPLASSARRRLNDLLAVRAYEAGRGRLDHFPVELYLQVASACNLDCFMCSEHNRPPRWRRGRGATSLPPELFAKVERELFPYASRLTIGVGGEPMISPHFLDYVSRAHTAGLRVHVMTNGTRINTDRAAETLARSTESLEVSVDAATRETYERIRLGSRWNALRANLGRLDRFRRESPEGERTHVTLCFVLMKSNADELPRFVEFAAEVGADRVGAWHVIPVTAEGHGESLFDEPERTNAILEAARARGAELGVEVDVPRDFPPEAADAASAQMAVPPPVVVAPGNSELAETETASGGEDSLSDVSEEEFEVSDHVLPTPGECAVEPPPSPEGDGMLREALRQLPGDGRIRCSSPTNSVFVFYDGRVLPCCHPHAHASMSMGNLAVQSFAEIWNGPLYRNLRAGLSTGDAPPLCRACSIVHSPPPVLEDAELLVGPGRDLASYYRGRDLVPLSEPDPRPFVVDALDSTFGDLELRDHEANEDRKQMRAHIADVELSLDDLKEVREHLEGHYANLERIVRKTRADRIYLALVWVKSLFVRKDAEANRRELERRR
jgi:radical SAM protein with 4Fe4S-binding SPASM domain